MKPIVIFGLGMMAEVAYHHMRRDEAFDVAAFTLDADWLATADRRFAEERGLEVVAFEEVDQHFPPERFDMFVAVGYHNLNRLRAERCEAARMKGYHLVSYISRVAECGDWAEVGDNCLILDSVGVQPGARVGDNVWVWNNTLIGHHSSVGDHCWLAAGTTIGGCARIAERCFVGLNATIGGDLRLGAESFIGAGALLTKDAKPQSVFITPDTERYRLDARTFLRMTRLATIGPDQQPEST